MSSAAWGWANRLGLPNLITFDMGGTTAKASLIEDGRWFEAFEYHVGGGIRPGRTAWWWPSLAHAFDRHCRGRCRRRQHCPCRRRRSAQGGAAERRVASPGPACYGMGGIEPTVTDAYAVLGYLNPESIAGGSKSISRALAERAIRERVASPLSQSVEEAAHAIYTVATANIIRAVRSVTIERGRDARDSRWSRSAALARSMPRSLRAQWGSSASSCRRAPACSALSG